MKQVLASRKFWAALVALLYSFLSALTPNFPINEELVLGKGLVLEEVGETRVSTWRRWPDLMEPYEDSYRFTDPALREMLPLQLIVVARRPGGPRPL